MKNEENNQQNSRVWRVVGEDYLRRDQDSDTVIISKSSQ